MAQGEGFKHITVTAAEDEDVVILAGAVPAEESEEARPSAPEPEQPEKPEETLSPASEPEPEPQPSKAAQPTASKRWKAKDDSYHETTLEDLEGAPMSLTQRIVIIAAIVCIIGAVIYCALFMG